MSDPIPTPGVRVGQVWQEVRARKGRAPRRVEVLGLGLGDVYGIAVDSDGFRFGPSLSQPRSLWDERYRLVSELTDAVSEGGAPDA
jgi:hypothetical protein